MMATGLYALYTLLTVSFFWTRVDLGTPVPGVSPYSRQSFAWSYLEIIEDTGHP
jgi:hypothetical protein